MPEEMQQILAEYCAELRNTETFQKDQNAAEENVLKTWARNYGDSNGRFKLYKAVGCDQCSSGYKGRVGLHELMIGTDRLKRLIQEHSRVAVMLAAALEDGMLTLKMDGMEKVLSGVTDIKQVRAVCIK
jgi:type II secretory ATPase GspE/PulE/Tfp pilus assembly ATPase PilB-like protein